MGPLSNKAVVNLFLDDERNPTEITWINLPRVTWNVVRSFSDFIFFVETNGLPNLVSFDHDLADCHYPIAGSDMEKCFKVGLIPYERMDGTTGYDAAKWLCNYCQENNYVFPEFYVHSMNPIGAENITKYIANYRKVVENLG